jgi:hypothetical protein
MIDLTKFTGEKDVWLTTPFTVVCPDRTCWGVATDWSWLIGIKGLKQKTPCKAPMKTLTEIQSYLQAPNEATESLPVQHFLQWVTAGLVQDAILLGVTIDATRLYDMLVDSDKEEMDIWVSSEVTRSLPSLTLESKDKVYRMVLMGLSGSDNPLIEYKLPGSAFDLVMELPT